MTLFKNSVLLLTAIALLGGDLAHAQFGGLGVYDRGYARRVARENAAYVARVRRENAAYMARVRRENAAYAARVRRENAAYAARVRRQSRGSLYGAYGFLNPPQAARKATPKPAAKASVAASDRFAPHEVIKNTVKQKLEKDDVVIVKNQSQPSKVLEVLPDGMVRVKNTQLNTEQIVKDADLARTAGCFGVCVGETVETNFQAAKLSVLGVFPSGAVQAGLSTMPEGEAGDSPLSFFLAPDEIGKTKGCTKTNDFCVGQKVTLAGYDGEFSIRSINGKGEMKLGQNDGQLVVLATSDKLKKVAKEDEEAALRSSVANSTKQLTAITNLEIPMECLEEANGLPSPPVISQAAPPAAELPNRAPAGEASNSNSGSRLESDLRDRIFEKRIEAAKAAAVKNGVAASGSEWRLIMNAKPYQVRSEALGMALDAKNIPEDAKAEIRLQCQSQTVEEVKALCGKLTAKFSR